MTLPKQQIVKDQLGRATELARRITLRAVKEEDQGFLLTVYATTRADELALVPWNDEQKQGFVYMQFQAQQEHYRNFFPVGKQEIILCDGRPVGRLYVARNEEEISILDITILPEERSAGIGSYLLRELMDEAAQTHKPLGVHVEDFNPSRRLFERLGFVPTVTEGIYTLMKWFPLPFGS